MAETGRMKELIDILNKAASVYYQGKDEIMSNFEYDRMYDELSALEKESGLVLAGSPTQKVGYEVLSRHIRHRCFRLTRQNRLMSFQAGWVAKRDFYHGRWMDLQSC